jgi:hypothetical protein
VLHGIRRFACTLSSRLGTDFAEPLAGCPKNEYEEVAMFNAGEQITVTK